MYKSSIFAVFLGDRNSSRFRLIPLPDDTQTRLSRGIDYYFVNVTCYNDTNKHFLAPGPFWDEIVGVGPKGALYWFAEPQQTRQLTAKLWFSFGYFLEHSDASWFFRATDDVMINYSNLDALLAKVPFVCLKWPSPLISLTV
jgi:hypothetical protein